MAGCRSSFLTVLGLLGALMAAPAISSAQAAVSEEAAARKVAEDYGVQVLKTRAATLDGREVWILTVMQPGGNRNSAFQVHTLAVDQETGELIPSFQHGASGYTLPPLPPGSDAR
ncbi:MAG: hypothetical protein Tsb0032_14890 [Kiloniellaceae bacterium]